MYMHLFAIFLVRIVLGSGRDCGYFAHGEYINPIGAQFCTLWDAGTGDFFTESHYYLCVADIPYIYTFNTSDCSGNYTETEAKSYWYDDNDIYVDFDYSCSDNECPYVHYTQYFNDECFWQNITQNDVTFSEYWVTDYCIFNNYANYYAVTCESDSIAFDSYSSSDCSGFATETESYPSDNCFIVHDCTQPIYQCGNEEVDKDFHVGDIVNNVFADINDICESDSGKILTTLISKLGMVCDGISFIGAICNIFKIDECRTDKKDSIVASCWSSKTFNYPNVNSLNAFSKYINETYGITSIFETTTDVSGEKYHQTEVYLDNCGKLDNYWIGGVYDALDNGEQNDIVSDVVEYLVNQGIASADNPVGGVSSTDLEESFDIKFTDVVRSKRGLLLHYNELTLEHTNFGIYFCEFNVIKGGHDADSSSSCTNINYYSLFVLFIICIISS